MGPGCVRRELSVNPNEPSPLLVAIDMGYGHLRAAAALGSAGGMPVLHADREPLAGDAERAVWRRARTLYETLSRGTDWPFVGPAFRRALESVTAIPRLRGDADLRPPTGAVRMLRRMAARGLGRGLVDHMRATGRPLLTTFYAPAIFAADAGLAGVTCVVTDVDVNRVWVPADPVSSRITYCVPAERTAERLRRYGVPADRIHRTGFPLPGVLTGGPDLGVLRRNLAARIRRLDVSGAFRAAHANELRARGVEVDSGAPGDPPLLTFAIGGSGAQVERAAEILAALGHGIIERRWRVALVAGTRAEVAAAFRDELDRLGLALHLGDGVELLHEPELDAYLARFHELLARTDILWTKPSEMTFYAGLGLPLFLSDPLGVHERCNRRVVIRAGAAFDGRTGDRVLVRLSGGLASGSFAEAAWNGFVRMPQHGTARILEVVAGTS